MPRIHPTAIVEPGAELAADCTIGPYCVIGPEASIAAGVVLKSHVVVEGRCAIGAGTIVYPFAMLGGPPQDLSYKSEPTQLIIGENNIIREHVSMHRGTIRGRSETRIGDRNYFMAQSHVAHDCVIGDDCMLSHGATLGGHVVVEDRVVLGGLCAIHQHGRVGRGAIVGGLAAVVADVIPYGAVFGNHARLEGLNYIGLKRRGLSKERIHALRRCFNFVFREDEPPFAERLIAARARFGDSPEAVEILDFIEADSKRQLCLP